MTRKHRYWHYQLLLKHLPHLHICEGAKLFFRVVWVIINNCPVIWSTYHHYWSKKLHFRVFFPLFTGLWYYVGGRDHPCLTLIGSPNFGYRSVHRDLEAQIAIVTENEELQIKLQQVGLPLHDCFLQYSINLELRCVLIVVSTNYEVNGWSFVRTYRNHSCAQHVVSSDLFYCGLN